MRQIEERDALHSGQPTPALPGPAGWATSPSTLKPAQRQGMYSSTGNEASADLHAAATAAWQGSGAMQRQASDPPTSMVGCPLPDAEQPRMLPLHTIEACVLPILTNLLDGSAAAVTASRLG
jgi:hypothetical protein